jgi:hypothetical protein
MALNKQILQKVMSKTEKDKTMQTFIVNVLQEENKGIGWYTKLYKGEIEKAIQEGETDEN